MNCRQAQNCIQLEVDAELPAELREPLTHHLDQCETCRHVRIQMRLMTRTLKQFAAPTLGSPALRFDRDTDPMRRWRIPLAAAASIAILLAGWMAVHPRPASTIPPLASGTPPFHTDSPPHPVEKNVVSLAKSTAPKPEVRVLISPESNVIALPVETRNPNITILKIYPKLQLAQSAETPGPGGT
jgi:anti-sigma factor RsiW